MPCFDLGVSKMRGRGLSFFKECCFRVRVWVGVSVNPKTVFFEKKDRPRPRVLLTPL